MDEEDGVFPLDTVTFTLRQPSNVIGEIRGPGAFTRSAYKLCVPLGFTCGGVKYPLEGYGAFPHTPQCMVVLCA